MKYVSEFQNPEAVKILLDELNAVVHHEWRIMEICGGQTHSLLRYGLDELLPFRISLLHGPGCPVCVTPLEMIDRAVEIASLPDVILCSFGDMLRVPGSHSDLISVRASGGDVRVVYSPMDAVALAQQNPHKSIVFFAIGFETTAPAVAVTVHYAKQSKVKNFFALVSHVLVPPAIKFLLEAPECRIQGFLAAGHVCTVMGYDSYRSIAQKYQIPIVVTGFEPYDLVRGILLCVQQLEQGGSEVVNQYSRSVQAKGNLMAQQWMNRVFTVVDRKWRGIGLIPQSGLALKPEYADCDAELRFNLSIQNVYESESCISGHILLGLRKPLDCPCFAVMCTPEHPLGATMVSAEGACSAYYQYKKQIPDSVAE
jgi:hydrogenase expression/formation protein HypD